MLTETFVAATATPEKTTNTTATGIHFHDLQPLPALKSTLKKSSINSNCLATSSTHVFAAQSDKAVIHVYNRDRNNQEAVVPFPERIRSIAIAGEQNGGGILVIGTEGGRLILWELCTGRQVSTPQHHLQAITCLAIDVTSTFILSGSADSNIHVWSLPALLSFSASYSDNGQDLPMSPIRSLSNHRAPVMSVTFGHSGSKTNIAVSASRDQTCVVWDYFTGMALHTFLLLSPPLCLTLDPVDRAAYVGYEGGSVQVVDFYKQSSPRSQLHDPAHDAVPTRSLESDRLAMPRGLDSDILCIQVSYDGTIILSGHDDGKVHTWDVARGKYQRQIVDFAAPITNLAMLRPTGFSYNNSHHKQLIKLHQVVKPRYESFAGSNKSDAAVPLDYKITAQLKSNLPLSDPGKHDILHEALTNSCFPAELLDEAAIELSAPQNSANGRDSIAVTDLQTQNANLSKQLKEANAKVRERDREDWKRQQDDELKAARKKKRRLSRIRADEIQRKQAMGEPIDDEDVEMDGDGNMEDDLSSDTDELTNSD